MANAVKEIITVLKKHNQQDGEVPKEVGEINPENPKNLKPKIIIASFILLALIVLGYFFIPKLFKSSEQVEKSIAVLPFKSLSNDPEKQYLADGVMDAILLHLQKFKDLRVMSRTSVEQYRGTTKTTHVIGQELDVKYLLEGSFQKFGDDVRLIVQLIEASEETHSWAKEYDRNWKDIFSVQSEVAQTIARELYIIITPGEKQLIEKISTTSMTAYDLYLKANNYLNEYEKTRNLSFYQKATTFYKAALEIDSAFAKAYTGLARTYYTRYFWETYYRENYLDSCLVLVNLALNFDYQLDEAYYLKGRYYQLNGHIEEALDNFDKTLELNPNYYQAYNYKGYLLTEIIKDFVAGIGNYQKALTIIRGDERLSLLRNLGWAYLDCGFIDKDKYYVKEILTLNEDSASYFLELAWIEFSLENFEECLKLSKKAKDFDSTLLIPQEAYICLPPEYKEEAYLNAKERIERFKKSGRLLLVGSHRVGYYMWQMGKKKEAEYYFGQQIKIGEESIKLSRDIAQKKFAHYDLAATYAFLGDNVKAYQYLDELNKVDFLPLWWMSLAKHDPLFNSIRHEERFQKILQNLEAKYEAEHERVRKWLEEQGML
ncbi:MAG: tetratricopeptide repeat protein [Bacteroidales bacterium]|nr:tetratricopeptide repeat protein [Bacteroidales bacterium]